MVFNLKGAMALIAEKSKGGIMAVNDKTKREMAAKHPKAEPATLQALLTGAIPPQSGELVKKCFRRGFTTRRCIMAQNGDRIQGLVNTMQRSRYSDKTTEYVDPRGLEAL